MRERERERRERERESALGKTYCIKHRGAREREDNQQFNSRNNISFGKDLSKANTGER